MECDKNSKFTTQRGCSDAVFSMQYAVKNCLYGNYKPDFDFAEREPDKTKFTVKSEYVSFWLSYVFKRTKSGQFPCDLRLSRVSAFQLAEAEFKGENIRGMRVDLFPVLFPLRMNKRKKATKEEKKLLLWMARTRLKPVKNVNHFRRLIKIFEVYGMDGVYSYGEANGISYREISDLTINNESIF